MPSPVTERLDVVSVGSGARLRLPLVPTLCGVVLGSSWVALVVALVATR